jgi:hypothetical protein
MADNDREIRALENDVRALLTKHDARVVVLIREDRQTAFCRVGVPPEDLRQDLITAANWVRDMATKNGAHHG